MHLLDQRLLGGGILVLLGTLVIVKRVATGSILDKPRGGPLVQIVNIFNLFFLLVLNPLIAVALLARRLPGIDPSHVAVAAPLVVVVELLGLVMYAAGFALMAWALLALAGNYQLGGSTPRSEDTLIVGGPYRAIRHPMYTAALSICLGLAALIQSWAVACAFVIYLVLILLLIPVEQDGLRQAYGEQYVSYQRETRALMPFIY